MGEGEGKEGTADDSIKCRCVNRQARTGQVGGFQNRGFYGRLSASVSSLSSPPLPRSFTYAIYRAVFDSCSSFFPPKPHRNACYAGQLGHGQPAWQVQKGEGEGGGRNALSLSPQTPFPFPFLPVGYPFRRRLAIRADCSKLG